MLLDPVLLFESRILIISSTSLIFVRETNDSLAGFFKQFFGFYFIGGIYLHKFWPTLTK